MNDIAPRDDQHISMSETRTYSPRDACSSIVGVTLTLGNVPSVLLGLLVEAAYRDGLPKLNTEELMFNHGTSQGELVEALDRLHTTVCCGSGWDYSECLAHPLEVIEPQV